MAGETDFGTEFSQARIGNPLLYVRRVFICVISSFFAQDDLNIFPGSPTNPYRLRCDDDGGIANDSGIFITDRYDDETVARRPQIVIGRGMATWGDIALGDFGQGINSGLANTRRHKTDTLSVPIPISVYAQNDIEAENIAWAVSFCIKAFEREIRLGSLIFKIESTAIGETSLTKASGEAEQFRIDLETRTTLGLQWVKSTTLTNEQIQKGFCKISGDPYPVTIGDLCIFADPVNKPTGWE